MMRSSSRILLAVVRAVLLTSLAASPVFAQRWSDLIPAGQRVRVRTQKDKEPFVGQFRPSPNDTLNVLLDPADSYSAPIAIPFASAYVKAVDVSQGNSRLTHGLAGFLFGAVAGGIIGAVIGDQGGHDAELAVLMGMAGAAGGAVVGTFVGAVSAPENWRNVYTDWGPRPNP